MVTLAEYEQEIFERVAFLVDRRWKDVYAIGDVIRCGLFEKRFVDTLKEVTIYQLTRAFMEDSELVNIHKKYFALASEAGEVYSSHFKQGNLFDLDWPEYYTSTIRVYSNVVYKAVERCVSGSL